MFIPPESVKKSVWAQKIINTITSFNNDKKGYGFDITGMLELPNMLRYMAPDINPNKKAGRYDWHMDVGAHGVNKRKLAMTVQLSDPKDYDGGDLKFNLRGLDSYREDNILGPPPEFKQQGSIVIFPSFLWHKVEPITRGTRYSLVVWALGENWK